jgi:2-dehydro-3-deoxyphosphooctonate aldolase (KDO 8-P synthase)
MKSSTRAEGAVPHRLVRVGSDLGAASALFGGKRLAVIAGPCVLESWDMAARVAESLRDTCLRLNLPYVFKASYAKANRSSVHSYRGPGLDQGLALLARIRSEFGVPVLTDVHEVAEAGAAGEVADALQIPAFLCRQTDLIEAAARTGRPVNIKKGQFLPPSDMEWAAEKASQAGSGGVLLTERGSSFGYGDLVVDMRSFSIMAETGWPVIFDVTHSLQQPGGRTTGGRKEFAAVLARAAVAAGADGVFLEAHPDPDNARSDSATMLPIEQVAPLLESIVAVRESLSATEPLL